MTDNERIAFQAVQFLYQAGDLLPWKSNWSELRRLSERRRRLLRAFDLRRENSSDAGILQHLIECLRAPQTSFRQVRIIPARRRLFRVPHDKNDRRRIGNS